MTHQIDMVLDFQYGSTGKGLIAGWLAKRANYDTAVCAFATNAGHTYIDKSRDIHMMTQQLPTAISSPTVKNVMLGPGSLIHLETLNKEIDTYVDMLQGKRIMIHPHAAVVADYHAREEVEQGMTKMGSTAKGVGAAMIERIRRQPEANVMKNVNKTHRASQYVVSIAEYDDTMNAAENIVIEGAQGFSLSIYHGQYPYTTSRDVTPWQVAADCGIPFKWANRIQIIGTLRTYPIRVNNRDGSSGPHYPDQQEISFSDIGQDAEVTTVTKLPRRLFTFSHEQLQDAFYHCGHYWSTKLFLNFANYMPDEDRLNSLIDRIEHQTERNMNPPKVVWLGNGADDKDVLQRRR